MQKGDASAFLAGFGSAVNGDCVALPDQSSEMLPLVMYNWWLWSGGKLDLPFTLCDRPSRPCVRLVMPLLVAIENQRASAAPHIHSFHLFAGSVREHLDVFEASGNEADMALPPPSGSRKGKIVREATKAPAELGQGRWELPIGLDIWELCARQVQNKCYM